eukprot:6172932-Pleurochrysis_carterae.AAC.2
MKNSTQPNRAIAAFAPLFVHSLLTLLVLTLFAARQALERMGKEELLTRLMDDSLSGAGMTLAHAEALRKHLPSWSARIRRERDEVFPAGQEAGAPMHIHGAPNNVSLLSDEQRLELLEAHAPQQDRLRASAMIPWYARAELMDQGDGSPRPSRAKRSAPLACSN